jgi:hypothetical protein
MTTAALKDMWAVALDSAAEAVQSGFAAGTLSADYRAIQLRHIRREREWLDRFDWPR